MSKSEMVVGLFREGVACSRIDRILGLVPGTSRKCVVQWWYSDKMTVRGSLGRRADEKGRI